MCLKFLIFSEFLNKYICLDIYIFYFNAVTNESVPLDKWLFDDVLLTYIPTVYQTLTYIL
jgi:hypothetical protein